MPRRGNTETSIAKRSVWNDLAEKNGMDREAFQAAIYETVLPSKGKGANPAEVATFLLVAKEYDLNPFTKEIYAFQGKGGGIVPVVGVDGWISLVQRRPAFDGVQFEDVEDEDGNLRGVTCTIHRKDQSHPTLVTEWFDEVKRPTPNWREMPRRMNRHKALIQCARVAFGLSGIYDEDEAREITEAKVIDSRPLSEFRPDEEPAEEPALLEPGTGTEEEPDPNRETFEEMFQD